MDQLNNQWLFVLVLSLTAFIPKVLPLLLAKGRDLSPDVKRWMAYIPAAIFAALVAADIFFYDGLNLHPLENVKLLPSFLVLIVSVIFKNLFVSMLVGVGAISLMIFFFGG